MTQISPRSVIVGYGDFQRGPNMRLVNLLLIACLTGCAATAVKPVARAPTTQPAKESVDKTELAAMFNRYADGCVKSGYATETAEWHDCTFRLMKQWIDARYPLPTASAPERAPVQTHCRRAPLTGNVDCTSQ